ncbi:MAG: hypothetical protein DMF17_13315, partial [Verrucomicrobia bacterium]
MLRSARTAQQSSGCGRKSVGSMTVRFADFTFDSAQRDLLRRGKRVHLSRKAFDILALLIARRPA